MIDPLVTVAVVAYNSRETIIETLESIKIQTYDNIELIVSDDCSTDDTVDLCKEWLSMNSNRFVRTLLLTSEKNQGVCSNSNKANFEAKGIWIKGIAADDILFPNCISDYIEYITQHKDANFVTSYMSVYNETFEENNCIDRYRATRDMGIYDQPLEVQVKAMAYFEFVQAPPCFYRKTLFEAVGGYHEKYVFEDWPFFLDVLEKGNRIYFMDKITVGYRAHKSASRSPGKLFKYSFLINTHQFMKERCFKYYSGRKIIATKFLWFVEWLMHYLHMDYYNKINSLIYRVMRSLCRSIGGRAY